MRLRERSLLDEIQREALDSSTSLADVLRKVVALGGEAGSADLRGWASRELRGYAGTDVDLPPYRKPGAVIKLNAINFNTQITGQQISPRSLPDFVAEKIDEEVPLNMGVGEIEAMLERARVGDGEIKLTLPMSQDIARYMNHEIGDPYQQITALYWSVSAVSLEGVLDQMRTTLVELVAEMRAAMPDSAETPPAAVADQAVQVVVHGKRPSVNVTSAQASGDGAHEVHVAPPTPLEKRPWWRGIWAALVGLATIVGTLIALAIWQGWGL